MTTFTTQDRLDAQRTPLTDEQIEKLAEYHGIDSLYKTGRIEFARAIERAHGITE
jgi:hypothetical protein